MKVGAVVLAVVFALIGVRSFVRWSSVRFEGAAPTDQLLFALHVTARTCVWFALAGAFVGFAVLAEPQRFRWYVLVPICLAVVQVLAAIALSRSPKDPNPPQGPLPPPPR